MEKTVKGYFCELNNKKYYKIENYDHMENFFMTITSSSDIWNFCWSKGGITAGRLNSNFAIFPYYTADKVYDAANYTGNYTVIAVEKSTDEIELWEPFTSMRGAPSIQKESDKYLFRNIYKNLNGTEVLFEEINTKLNIKFITGWTSSDKYGLVRFSQIVNLNDKQIECSILDGCQNIMPACSSYDLQNNTSILLDAYKKSDIDEKGNIALISLSSVVSDKAEPNESLYANTCWFTETDKIMLEPDAPVQFVNISDKKLPEYKDFNTSNCLKGERASCFICKKFNLTESQSWYQVFNTALTPVKIAALKQDIDNRKNSRKLLEQDIADGELKMSDFLRSADGIQTTNDELSCLHHRENVMFNIMRGGIILNDGRISSEDFLFSIKQRNKNLYKILTEDTKYKAVLSSKSFSYNELFEIINKTENAQLKRLFLEYIPLTFSRRHGDPSRPWNIFSIKIKDAFDNPILNYEGNWRDIFQNWEALVYSYPEYIKNICSKFLNAMTIDGFNPYKINREGIDWEVPDPWNPWAQYGYWGDHQVIYFEKLLEFYLKINKEELLANLNEKLYTTSNVPYRLSDYNEILKNPRSSLKFDRDLSNKLLSNTKANGSDEKLVKGKDEYPYLSSFAAKVLQIVLTKAANFVPGGGIWLNTQRPEWNDANNALAGYGLSVVTLGYLYRFTDTLIKIFSDAKEDKIVIPSTEKKLLVALSKLYSEYTPEQACKNDKTRKEFTDKLGLAFQNEKNELYKYGFNKGETTISSKEVIKFLSLIKKHAEYSIKCNKREDGLYHSYNTLKITDDKMEIVYLQEMLEGQVSILSSGLLSPAEAKELMDKLYASRMYEKKQNSFMLYPNKELPLFTDKNCIDDIKGLEKFIDKTRNLYLQKDCNGIYHFNSDFSNKNQLLDFINRQDEKNRPNDKETNLLLNLYEKTFNHQSFTGRSGTFYAYEGLGSIYWHMVSKLLLAVQENTIRAYDIGDKKLFEEMKDMYYKVRNGLGYNKSPEIYGAFPADPYSHTPYQKGARQPGMTGQVKEEILTRWNELGLFIENGSVTFNPYLLKKEEIPQSNELSFTWCKTPIKYHFNTGLSCVVVDNQKYEGNTLSKEITKQLISRNEKIREINVYF